MMNHANTLEAQFAAEIPTCESLYKVNEVANMLGVSNTMVYKLIHDEEIDAIRVGRLVRISPEAYCDFVRTQTRRR